MWTRLSLVPPGVVTVTFTGPAGPGGDGGDLGGRDDGERQGWCRSEGDGGDARKAWRIASWDKGSLHYERPMRSRGLVRGAPPSGSWGSIARRRRALVAELLGLFGNAARCGARPRDPGGHSARTPKGGARRWTGPDGLDPLALTESGARQRALGHPPGPPRGTPGARLRRGCGAPAPKETGGGSTTHFQ
ncbi:hypothetical protein SMALA_4600 [Streptomyces malaysiensis subsp. malaysiensis]|nr:hypothetical protein SMALA_4600 [Streptomyces malaysiensis]